MQPIRVAVGSLSLSSFNIALSIELENIVYLGGQHCLEEFQVLELSGSDVATYLQNQTTNDVYKLTDNSFQLNTLLDNAGKLVTFFYLVKKDSECFFVILHKDLVNATSERLERFLVSEDVQIIKSKKIPYLILGHQAIKSLESHFTDIYNGEVGGEVSCLTFEDRKLSPLDKKQFEKFLIVSGEPFWQLTLFQLELLNNTILLDKAYDRRKGCFLGQETVAKVESRRGAAFRPHILQTNTKVDLVNGTELRKDSRVGKVIRTFNHLDSTWLLAALNRETRVLNSHHSLTEPHKITFTVRPYPLYLGVNKASDFYHFAIECFQAGSELEAEDYFLKAIEVDPLFEDAYEGLGVLYGRQEKFTEAIELMQKLSELNSKSIMAHTNLSLFYMKIGDIKTAEEHKSLATVKQFEVLGDEAESRRSREKELERAKQESIRRRSMFEEVLEIDSEDALANHGIGEIEFQEGNYQKVIEYAEKALRGDRKYSVAWLLLGKAYLALGELKNAVSVLEEGIGIASKQGDMMPANEMQNVLQETKQKSL